jgi:hypothetical protein
MRFGTFFFRKNGTVYQEYWKEALLKQTIFVRYSQHLCSFSLACNLKMGAEIAPTSLKS